jgi:hypothetical protein
MLGDIRSMKHWKLSKMRTPERSPVIFQAKPCAPTGRKKRRVRRIEAQSLLPQRSQSVLSSLLLGPSSRCASAIQIVRPLESIAETQPQLHPALLRLSVSNSARRSEADDFAIEPALQFLREAFEVNQLAVEPVHRQLTA